MVLDVVDVGEEVCQPLSPMRGTSVLGDHLSLNIPITQPSDTGPDTRERTPRHKQTTDNGPQTTAQGPYTRGHTPHTAQAPTNPPTAAQPAAVRPTLAGAAWKAKKS